MDRIDKGFIFLSNTGNDCVSILSSENGDIIKNINMTANSGPHGITVCRNRQFIYFTNSYNGSISLYNMKEKIVSETVCTGTTPCHIAENNGKIYVSNFDSDSVTVIDHDERAGIMCIPSGRMPHDIINIDGSVIVAESGSESLGIIDADSSEYSGRIAIATSPAHMKRLENSNLVVVAGTEFGMEIKGYVCIVDIKQGILLERIRIGHCLTDICVEGDGLHVYVSDGGSGCIYKINIASGMVVSNLYVSGFPAALSSDASGKFLFVLEQQNSILYRIKKSDMSIVGKCRAGRDAAHIFCSDSEVEL